jgi:hypothetical protein
MIKLGIINLTIANKNNSQLEAMSSKQAAINKRVMTSRLKTTNRRAAVSELIIIRTKKIETKKTNRDKMIRKRSK